jgi:hypothetical protein
LTKTASILLEKAAMEAVLIVDLAVFSLKIYHFSPIVLVASGAGAAAQSA